MAWEQVKPTKYDKAYELTRPQWLAAEIREHNLSVPKLAAAAGLHPQTIYNYIAGRSDMTCRRLGDVICAIQRLAAPSPRGPG